MFAFSGFRRGTSRHFFIAASFALPDWKYRIWIRGTLVHGAIGGNNFAATLGTRSTPGGALLNIDR